MLRGTAVALVTIAWLAGCAMPYRPPQFQDDAVAFPGVVGVAEMSGPGVKLDVLLVHGMCTHDAQWATEAIDRILKAIDTNLAPLRAEPRPLVATSGVEIIRRKAVVDGKEIRFSAIVWSPLTTGLKQQLCYDQTDKFSVCLGTPAYGPLRATLNAHLKDGLLDDCLADAIIYQGQSREEIKRQMKAAILEATAHSDDSPAMAGSLEALSAAQSAPLVIVAESLGSKIVFDTLFAMSEEGAASSAARNTIDRTAVIFMGANQIPILHLADQVVAPVADKGVPKAPAQPDSLQKLLAKRSPGAKFIDKPAITVVAFSDPNDLLSYTLRPAAWRPEGVDFVDVLVSNDWTYFGALERPDNAHLVS
jgi:hypothetical protein